MMKVGTVGGVYFRFIWCRLTWVNLEEGPVKDFIFSVMFLFSITK